ncbi:putative Synaptogyrin-1 [Hypsibius exemplaris]|uniref:Synaptogyrin-1 n=1 Tax=Hypsibius exemplaris TaxID=2072580 RepID=A0A9X6NDW5_HYPEX|nr:putative Synaptogyrin-1 [Hypsibius exemplaris]
MNAGGAYGAGKAGQAFDPLTFFRRPAIILRCLAVLFAIIVFGCLTSEGYLEDKCIMNESGACGFAILIGVLAFLGGLALLALEAKFESISSIKIRRRAVIGDLGFTAGWAFFWFVAFCYMVNQWGKTTEEPEEGEPKDYGRTNANAAITFAFFSVFVWAGCAYFTYLRYRQGAANAFAPSGLDGDLGGPGGLGGMPRGGGGYASYPGAPDDHYQEAPGAGGQQGFQSPAY